jgi:signal transduction histidine kinase
MRRLVEDLLYLSRIESGDLAIQRAPIDLAELARAAQARFLFRAQESGIAFEVNARDAVTVSGDSHRLGQVLDNLIENAFKFTPPTGRVTLMVSKEAGPLLGTRQVRGPGTAIVSVHNTGSYIPPGEAERVFERFYQLDKARTGRRGSGLGLAIARQIVQAHGGRIELQSSAQTGTTFTVRMPALDIQTPTTPVRMSEATSPAEVGAAS